MKDRGNDRLKDRVKDRLIGRESEKIDWARQRNRFKERETNKSKIWR